MTQFSTCSLVCCVQSGNGGIVTCLSVLMHDWLDVSRAEFNDCSQLGAAGGY